MVVKREIIGYKKSMLFHSKKSCSVKNSVINFNKKKKPKICPQCSLRSKKQYSYKTFISEKGLINCIAWVLQDLCGVPVRSVVWFFRIIDLPRIMSVGTGATWPAWDGWWHLLTAGKNTIITEILKLNIKNKIIIWFSK
jgi:hypothetical protein